MSEHLTEQNTDSSDETSDVATLVVETEEEGPTTPATDLTTEEGVILAIANAGEGIVDRTDLPRVMEILGALRANAESLRSHVVSLTNLRRKYGQEAAKLARVVQVQSGKPDWVGSTKTFKMLFKDNIVSLMGEKLEKGIRSQEADTIMTHYRRTYREPAIRQYVFESVETEVVDGQVVTVGRPESPGVPALAKGLPWTIAPDSPAFIHELKREFNRCEIAIPNTYLSADEIAGKRTEAGPQPGPEDAAEFTRKAAEGAASFSPVWTSAYILQAVDGLVAKVSNLKSGDGFNRPLVADLCQRAAIQLQWIDKYLTEEKGTPDELDGLHWGEKDKEAVSSY